MNSHETQYTITDWGIATFGERTAVALSARMLLEVAELVVAVRETETQSTESVMTELADVVISASALASELNCKVDFTSIPLGTRELHTASLEAVATISTSILNLAAVINNRVACEVDASSQLRTLGALCRAAARWAGTDLQEEVDRKMKINRARRWQLSEDGGYQHV